DFLDALTDAVQGIGGTPLQYIMAKDMLSNLVKATESTKTPIKVTGHSLGGGLAAYATIYNDYSRVTTTTFNPAGLSFFNWNLLKSWNAPITNIRVEGELLASVNRLLVDIVSGDDYDVTNNAAEQHKGLQNGGWGLGWLINAGVDSAWNVYTENWQSHGMDVTITYMKLDMIKRRKIEESNRNTSGFSEDGGSGEGFGGGGGGGEEAPSGDLVCRPGEGEPPTGDLVSMPGEGGTPTGDLVSMPGEGEQPPMEEISVPIVGDIGLIGGDAPGEGTTQPGDSTSLPIGVPLPSIHYSRLLFIFSGEANTDVVKDITKNLGNITKEVERYKQDWNNITQFY
ncbi:MAG: hypothetical protein IJT83_01955, partial [Victivallales bacterium]|nr:hypothetical protein [Victivallales bacterium]